MKFSKIIIIAYFSLFLLLGLMLPALSQETVREQTITVYGINEDANTSVPPPPTRKPLPRRPGTYVRSVDPQFSVNYSGFTTEARVAFQYAVNIWTSQISSPVTIRVDARFVDMGGENPDGTIDLGSVSARLKLRSDNRWYTEALSDKLAGADLDSSRSDIRARFNSNNEANWYFGMDGNTPSGKVDFVTVVLHELGHGLGFLAMGEPVDGKGTVRLGGHPGIYDSFVENGAGTDLTDTTAFPDPSVALLNQLIGGNLFWNGAKGVAAYGGNRPKLYAPNPWDNGSSYIHLDENTFWSGSVNSLMTPLFRTAEAIHNPGPITLGMLEDMGWTITHTPLPEPCTYTLSANYEDVPAAGTSLQVDVQTDADCEWAATSNSNFLSVTPSTVKGSGTVTVTVRQNTGAARIGTLTIAGKQFTVVQDAYTAPPPPPPPIRREVCDRTSVVRNAFVRESPVSNCANVTEAHLNAIMSLNLAGYRITTLEQSDFDKLWSLEKIDLARNRLRTIPTGLFWYLTELTELNLSDNRLTTLESRTFASLSNLEYLSLTGNQLTKLPTGVFERLNKLKALDLQNNPGTPFTLTLKLVRTDTSNLIVQGPATVVVKLDQGAPFDMTVSLSVLRGTLSAPTAKITRGNTQSDLITVTQSGNRYTVVRLGPAPTVPTGYLGIEMAVGQSIVLFGTRPVPQTVVKISGDNQRGYPGQALQHPFVVEVRNAVIGVLEDIDVTFAVTAGDGMLSETSVLTDSNGRAQTTLTVGHEPGKNTVRASVEGIAETVTFTAEGVRTPTTLLKISGDNQQGYPGKILENPLIVEVRDAEDSTLEGVDVKFEVTAGNGTLSEITVSTNVDGRAESILTLGPDEGTNTVSVSVTEIQSPVLFTAEGVRTPTTLLKISGDNQNGVAGVALTNPFVVEVKDDNDLALEAVPVTFEVTAGGGTLSKTSTTTDSNGRVESTLTLGQQPGQNTVEVTVAALEPVTFTAIGEAIPQTLMKSSGDQQTGLAGTQLVASFVVEVRDQNDEVFPGAVVTFAVTEGDGTLSTTNATTNANGRAESTLTLGQNPGQNTVSVSVAGITEAVTFTAIGEIEFNLAVPEGLSLIHAPLKVTAVDGVATQIESIADLYDALGGADTVSVLITYDPETQRWSSYLGPQNKGKPSDRTLTDDLGIIASMKAPASVRLRGDALGTNGHSLITLHPGTNLVGVPLKDSRITRVSDLFALEGIADNVSVIIVTNNGAFKVVTQMGDTGDNLITGGSAFILTARMGATVVITGTGWSNPDASP